MININLTTKEENIETSSLGKEWGVFLVAIIAAALIYLGVFGYNRWLNQDLGEKNKEYETKHNSLLEKGKSVFDFQNRLETAKPLVAKKNYALESLGQIEKAIIPEVYVESFNFDSEKGQIDLTCVAQRYRLVANQIASLKKIDYFSEVATDKTSTRDNGKIEFLLKLKIKDNQIKK
jgi:type II secretory pathway component PulL